MAQPPKILLCSCEDTMPLDGSAVRQGCRGAEVSTARQLCRAELEKFRAAAAGGGPLIVGCTQETPLFSEVAGSADITYANIRETADQPTPANSIPRQYCSAVIEVSDGAKRPFRNAR